MFIDLKTMDQMHSIQFEMLKELIKVMDTLQVKYYFVHGSLLGAIRQHDFIIEDDDIDIAVPRNDYNRLMREGNGLLDKKYFLQTSINDDFPLAFGKMRNSSTTFLQPVLDNYECNKGIYIDIFPLDYSPSFAFLYETRIKLMGIRINSKIERNESIMYRFTKNISKILYPSIESTMKKREQILSQMKASNLVSVYGGKRSERKMPLEWFGEGKKVRFRDIEVNCPDCTDLYLKRIYGEDYLNHNPAQDRISSDYKIEISAEVLDFEKTYSEYTR